MAISHRCSSRLRGPTSEGLTLLLAAGGAVILIVCVNIASLLLIRVNGRRREIAIRTAMGAGTARLIRQLATESLLLAGIAGVIRRRLRVSGFCERWC